MLKQHARIVSRMLFLLDLAVAVLSFEVAYWLRVTYPILTEKRVLAPIGQYYWLLPVFILSFSFFLFRFGAYRSHRTTSFIAEMSDIWKAVLCGGLAIGAVAFASKSTYISRSFIVTFIAVALVSLTAVRLLVRSFSWGVRKRGFNFRNVIIVGTDEAALQVADSLLKYRQWGFRLIGFVTECPKVQRVLVGSHPVLGCIDDMEEIVKRHVVDEVVFSLMGKRMRQYEETFLMLEDLGINTRIVANFFPHLIARVRLDELDNIPLLTFTTGPSNIFALKVKRLFDIAASLVLLLGALPFMAAAAAAVRMTSPGPVFFKQKRAGLNGRIFTLLKFRSMYEDAEERKDELAALNEMKGPVFKIRDDPRITPVGRFIRKTSIDELPQLWNVLRGDMSIVGPRPPIPHEVQQYQRWQRRRLSMRPGITCLWQVNGRNTVTRFDEWAKMDLEYIDTWSLELDMKIFLKTIPAVLFRKGAA